jgi:hypothetical protein
MIAFLLSTVAFAAEPTPPTPGEAPRAELPKFEDLDVNRDNLLERVEVSNNEMIVREFVKIDTDKNDKISKEEYKAWVDLHKK